MKIIETIPEMKSRSREVRSQARNIGFVPTMGFLHEGHMSLVEKSVSTCDFTVASIFINPAQFGENEDLDRYPKDLENDQKKLESAGVDVLYLPRRETMYPEGFKTYVQVESLVDHLCGKSRPGFFKGVATVVLKLLNIVQPNKAFFGEKDWQQSVIIETMIRDLNLDVELVRLPIVREADHLAMSSRNVYLSSEERQSALFLSKALEEAQARVQGGESSAEKIRQGIREKIEKEDRAKVDYVSICDPENFVECEKVLGKTLIALAVNIGKARLIDNCIVERI